MLTRTYCLLQCCIQLAQGKLSTEQLTDEVISLVSTHSPRHLSNLSFSGEQHGDSKPSVEIIRMMQKLSDRAKHAQQCCSCIITCFKIAVVSHSSALHIALLHCAHGRRISIVASRVYCCHTKHWLLIYVSLAANSFKRTQA